MQMKLELEPIPVSDVLRAAVAEIEDATRVRTWAAPRVSLNGGSVADVIHLLAELVENAAAFSPPSTKVQLRAARLAMQETRVAAPGNVEGRRRRRHVPAATAPRATQLVCAFCGACGTALPEVQSRFRRP